MTRFGSGAREYDLVRVPVLLSVCVSGPEPVPGRVRIECAVSRGENVFQESTPSVLLYFSSAGLQRRGATAEEDI